MSVEFEATPEPVITVPTPSDVESYRRMQAASWLDTYPNPEAGVSLEWVQAQVDSMLAPEALELSRHRVEKILQDKDSLLYIAKVGDQSVGMVSATRFDDHQRIEALYVAKEYHGTGTAQQLLDQVFSEVDLSQPIMLEVVAYNERAQRFYQKNGFAIIPGSEHYFKEVLPSLRMIRIGEEK